MGKDRVKAVKKPVVEEESDEESDEVAFAPQAQAASDDEGASDVEAGVSDASDE